MVLCWATAFWILFRFSLWRTAIHAHIFLLQIDSFPYLIYGHNVLYMMGYHSSTTKLSNQTNRHHIWMTLYGDGVRCSIIIAYQIPHSELHLMMVFSNASSRFRFTQNRPLPSFHTCTYLWFYDLCHCVDKTGAIFLMMRHVLLFRHIMHLELLGCSRRHRVIPGDVWFTRLSLLPYLPYSRIV